MNDAINSTSTPVKSTNAAWYALRRTLPPWKFEENLEELVRCAGAYRLDEVVVKVDSEEFHHGHGILEWLRAYQPCLHKTREALNAVGVDYSLNPWISIGHNDRGRDSIKQLPGLQTVVSYQGKAMKNRACPLSPVWRENVGKLWTLYAETKPKVIWIEDDIKFHLGGGCFCPLHLAEFSKRIGRPVEREEIVAAVNAPGEPHPWREIFLQMLADTVIDAVGFLTDTVHAVSPDTSIGLMSSGPRNHCKSAHRWQELAAILSDGGKRAFYSRPPLGSYSESSLRALYHTQDSIKITRHCIGAAAIDQTEVESWPFSQYSKSTAFTFLQMAVSFAYGARGVTMNIFDHLGRAMEATPELGRMLGERKPFLNALAAAAQSPGVYCGVQIPQREDWAIRCHLPPDSVFAFPVDGFRGVELLEACGIPTVYDESPVVMLEGQSVRTLAEAELRGILGKGVMIDGHAAAILAERGFAAEIGLETASMPQPLAEFGVMAAEELHNPDFGGARRIYMTATLPALSASGKCSRLQPLTQACEVSRFVDPDEKTLAPASIVFENSLGGRVFVMAHELASCHSGAGGSMLNLERCRLLQSIQRWLGRGAAPVEIAMNGAYPLLFRKDCGAHTLVGAFNLSLDDWPEATFTVADPRQPVSVSKLEENGAWTECRNLTRDSAANLITFRSGTPVGFRLPVIFLIHW